MTEFIPLPEVSSAPRANAKPVFVIAQSIDGLTYIGSTAIGIYDHGINKQLMPDWTCGVGEAATTIYEILERECPMHKIAMVGFFTAVPFARVVQLARDAVNSLTAQCEGIAA